MSLDTDATATTAPRRSDPPARPGAPRAAARPGRPGAAGGGSLSERVTRALAVRFRLPGADDPAPEPRRLAGLCGWAAALGIAGLIVAVQALIGFFTVDAGWYRPTVVLVGLSGLVCTIGALASVHRQRLPWLMLGAATAALLTAEVLVLAAA